MGGGGVGGNGGTFSRATLSTPVCGVGGNGGTFSRATLSSPVWGVG